MKIRIKEELLVEWIETDNSGHGYYAVAPNQEIEIEIIDLDQPK